jgi:hypothetical protein
MPVSDIFVLVLILFCVTVVASLEIRSRRRTRAAASAEPAAPEVETDAYESTPHVTASRRAGGRQPRRR